ncbi:MAG: hypothetical protein OCD76_15140 [Reichenbachiella sp.]
MIRPNQTLAILSGLCGVYNIITINLSGAYFAISLGGTIGMIVDNMMFVVMLIAAYYLYNKVAYISSGHLIIKNIVPKQKLVTIPINEITEHTYNSLSDEYEITTTSEVYRVPAKNSSKLYNFIDSNLPRK